MAERRAVFLDRDGTVVLDPPPGYLHEAEKVQLFPGAGPAVRQLNDAGFLVVTVSNQAGIARRLYDAGAYEAVQRRLGEILARDGARLDASFFCPHHPDFTGPCDCRKPGLRLFQEAGRQLGITMDRSFWVGDRLSDLEPARAFGGQGILVETGRGHDHVKQARGEGFAVAPDLAGAVRDIILTSR